MCVVLNCVVVHRTWSTHPDYAALENALKGVSEAATGVNAFVKASDGAAKVKEIMNFLCFFFYILLKTSRKQNKIK